MTTTIPAGHKLVPIEPTDDMLDAGCGQHSCAQGDPWYSSPDLSWGDCKDIYAAMLSAAPASPVSTVEQGDAHEEIHALRQCAIKYLKWLGVSDPHAGLESDLRNPEMVSKSITMTHPTARDWKAIDAAVREYLDGYEMEGDGGYYVPNNRERAILDDAVAGLLADDDFLAHMGRPAPAAGDARALEDLQRLIEYAQTSDDCQYGTLSTALVRDLTEKAIAALSAAPTAGDAQTDAARDVLAERQRQISVEGWEPERDDTYQHGELAHAAASYAQCAGMQGEGATTENAFKTPFVESWPWSDVWWKPSAEPRRNLVKAGALILAEIERLDRAAQRQGDA